MIENSLSGAHVKKQQVRKQKTLENLFEIENNIDQKQKKKEQFKQYSYCLRRASKNEVAMAIQMFRRLNQVAMAPHGPILCQREAHHPQQAFLSTSRPLETPCSTQHIWKLMET